MPTERSNPGMFDMPPASGEGAACKSHAAKPPGGPAPLTVSELIRRVKLALADSLPRRIAVVGEISNLKIHSSGHIYFRLKDAQTAIDAAMFRQHAGRLKFRPTDGLEVVVEGRVDVYDVRGQLQLYVERLTPKGAGALELAFRQLCEKLRAEGLFDPDRKKPLCPYPRAVGLVTSPTGAAIRDIRRTLSRRWPSAGVFLMPALVQGDGAAQSVAEGIRLLDAAADRLGIDTILVARGGGSMEDLWAFNEEIVARAIFAARTPIICGVGHEVDITVADLVADVRAATPTAAAELAVPDHAEVRRQLDTLARRLRRQSETALAAARGELLAVMRSVVFRDPAWRLKSQSQRLDELGHRLRSVIHEALRHALGHLSPLANRLAALHPSRLCERARAGVDRLSAALAWALGARSKRAQDNLAALAGELEAAHPRHRLALARQQLTALERQLDAMSHRSVLKRGFSLTRDARGNILRSAADAAIGDHLLSELADGTIHSIVEPAGQAAARPGPPSPGQPTVPPPLTPASPERSRPVQTSPRPRKPRQNDPADGQPRLF